MRSHIMLRERLFDQPLLCTSTYANVVVTVLAERLGVEPLVAQDVVSSSVRPAFEPHFDRNTGIVQFPVVGGMVHRGGGMDALSGVQSYTDMHNELDRITRTMGVKGVMLDLDTPGGEAAGITELSAVIREFSSNRVPIWACVNSRACSGGYWLAASADRVIAAPMSVTGSIGVVTMHQDVSKALDKRGVVTTMIFAGKHKVDGNPYEPLPEEVRTRIQAGIDDLYNQFVGAVASMRDLDEKDVRATEAAVFSPEQALELGLVDQLGTRQVAFSQFDQFVNRAIVPGFTSSSEKVSMEKLYTQADMDRARTEGLDAGKVEGVKIGHAAAVEKMGASIKVLAPDHAGLQAFSESLTEGASIELSQKMAQRVAAAQPAPTAAAPASTTDPKTTAHQEDVRRVMEGASPNVANGPEQRTTDKEARLAEIGRGMKSFNRSRGFGG